MKTPSGSLIIWTSHQALSGEIRVTQLPDNLQPLRGHGILGQAADRAWCLFILAHSQSGQG